MQPPLLYKLLIIHGITSQQKQYGFVLGDQLMVVQMGKMELMDTIGLINHTNILRKGMCFMIIQTRLI